MNNIVRIWIGNPYEGGNFNGTAFFIDKHTLVTAKHVVSNRENTVYQHIFISNTPDGGVTPIDSVKLCHRDIAILKVQKSFNIEDVVFEKNIEEGKKVNVIGFYDKDSSQKTYENRVSGYQSSEHTYELQNHLTKGLSGAPVLFDGKICGIAKAINTTKNITYIIPISEVCIELNYLDKKEIVGEVSKKKKLTLERVGIIASIIGVVVSIVVIFLPSSKESAISQTLTISGKDNIVTQEAHVDNNIEQFCIDGITQYQKTIDELSKELEESTMPELKKIVNRQLKQSEKDLINFKIKNCK